MTLPRTYMKAWSLASQFGSESPRWDAAQAAYWWLAENHNGQWSNRYAELCWLGRYYRPGALEKEPTLGLAQEVYAALSSEEG